MLQGNGIALIVGVAIAVAAGGDWIRTRPAIDAARDGTDDDSPIDQRDRERMLQLLQELGSWTSEYSGNVSEYQARLGQMQ